MPDSRFSCSSIARWEENSSRSSRARRLRPNKPQNLTICRFQPIALFRRPQHAADCPHESLPARGLGEQLASPRRCEAVVLGSLIVFGNTPSARNPAFLLQPLQRGVKRPVLHLEGILRQALNGLGDAVAVSWTPEQRAQNQHVERAINKFDPVSRLLLRHSGS